MARKSRKTGSDETHSAEGLPPTVRIGVSSCLMGEPVRWDGNDKRDGFIAGVLATHVELVPVCPEVGIGLGVPRDPIRLVRGGPGSGDEVPTLAVGVKDPTLDVTEPLRRFAARMMRTLPELHGYLFKSDSPSCGPWRVKRYPPPPELGGRGGPPARNGVGIYAAEVMAADPLLPVEDERRLDDPALREHFIERVFVYARWKAMLAAGPSMARLMAFHNRHKLILMAHGAEPARRLGRLLGQGAHRPPGALAHDYGREMMTLLAKRATPRSHTNVLHHLMGYLKRHLDAGDKAELLEAIDAYRREMVPLIVPLTLFKHHFRRHPHAYVEGQAYLLPYPDEMMLRNR